jgi:hypothetical protein
MPSATNKAVIARLDRATQYAVASVLLTNASGILDHPLKPVVGLAGRRDPMAGDND